MAEFSSQPQPVQNAYQTNPGQDAVVLRETSVGAGTNIFKANKDGVFVGGTSYDDAPLKIDYDGTLTATGATIGGTVNATGGTFSGNITVSGTLSGGTITGAAINGGTIIGGTYKTVEPGASTGRAVVITGGSNQDINFYRDSTNYATIGTLITSSGGEQEFLRIEAVPSGRMLRFRESNIGCDGNFNPTNDNAYDVGSAGTRWRVGFFEDIVVDDLTVNTGCSGCAYIELNLLKDEQKQELLKDSNEANPERKTKSYTGFEAGDVLVWKHGQLELSSMDTCPCVTAVASSVGTPIVLGAEKVKVVGKVKENQFLVTGPIAGHARAWNEKTNGNPPMGTVIAQAMEDKLTNEPGTIMAMIRKF